MTSAIHAGTRVSEDGLPYPRRFWALFAATLAIIMAGLDGTIVNIALQRIAADLSADNMTVVWVVLAYQIAVSVALFPLAALGERHGHHRIYVFGLVLFTLASLICSFSSSIGELIAARALQGLGASGIMSVNIALTRAIFPKRLLGRGVAYNTLVVGMSAAAGPSAASLILAFLSWKWLFLINVPVGIVAALVGMAALPATAKVSRPFDFPGALLTACGLGSLILAIDGAGRGDPPAFLAFEFLLAAGLVVLLVRHQGGKADPLMPIDLLRTPLIGLSGLTAAMSYIVQGLSYVSLPFYFHDGLGLDQAGVAAALTPWPLAIVVASPLAGRLLDHVSAAVLSSLGLVLLTVGLITVVFVAPGATLSDLAWRTALCGFGFGLFQVPNSKTIIEKAPPGRSGGASAIQASSRLFGQSIGAALVAACFGLFPQQEAAIVPVVAVFFAAAACLVSSLRIGRQ